MLAECTRIADAADKSIHTGKAAGKAAVSGPGAFKIIPVSEARSILCSILQCELPYLYAHGNDEVEPAVVEKFRELIRLRSQGMPLQHITGTQEFMSLAFEVNGDVLIPRQDTEILVETIMEEFQGAGHPVRILDLCTGSGCIAVSLAHYMKHCVAVASDLSPAALGTASRNACRHGVLDRVELVHSNLFEKLGGKFDAIVSNPPYIPKADIEVLETEVRDFEPRMALDGGADGLDFYRSIVIEAPRFLVQGGMLAFETGFDQAQAVAGLMSSDFTGIRIVRDLSGIDRVVAGYYNVF